MRLLLVAPLVVLGTFCAHQQTPHAGTVKVSYRESAAAGCTSLGLVYGSVNTSAGQNRASLDATMRQKAANKGGNLIVLRDAQPTSRPAIGGGTELEAVGEVFACARRTAPVSTLRRENNSSAAEPAGPAAPR